LSFAVLKEIDARRVISILNYQQTRKRGWSVIHFLLLRAISALSGGEYNIGFV
jgi:hypothetical protein